MTAEDVRFSIDRSMKFKGGWGFLLDSVKSLAAPNPQTFVITLKEPHAPLLADLAMYAYAILPEKAVKAQPRSSSTTRSAPAPSWSRA